MTPVNILDLRSREDFRRWLQDNHASEKECWISVKRGKSAPDDMLWYLDAVEEALCFGWIDSTVKNVGGVSLQRFGPRRKGSIWTELNKERCRRLERLGLMTEAGRKVTPDLNAEFEIQPQILKAFIANETAWRNFQQFPELYRRVRIDNIQRKNVSPDVFESRLAKLIAASEKGVMIGDWNDCGRLFEDNEI